MIMPGRSWFVAAGEKQEGPYSEEEFRDLIARGHIRPDTYVWADGMQDWKYAGDIPGLLSPGRAPPPTPRPGVPMPSANADHGGGSLSAEFSIWEMLGRAIVFVIGFLLVIPAPWVAASFYGWMISRIHVPGRGYLGFTGKPLDIWYVFVGLALMTYIGGALDIPFLSFVLFPLQAYLSWMTVRWVMANLTAEGRPLQLSFDGSPWGYIGWYLLLAVSFITIIGWAWVIVYWMRWRLCRQLFLALAQRAFLCDRGHQRAVLLENQAARQAASVLCARRILSVEHPFVGAERAMEPHRMVEARRHDVLFEQRPAVPCRDRIQQRHVGRIGQRALVDRRVVRQFRVDANPEMDAAAGSLGAEIALELHRAHSTGRRRNGLSLSKKRFTNLGAFSSSGCLAIFSGEKSSGGGTSGIVA
jgi:hypothetical protein